MHFDKDGYNVLQLTHYIKNYAVLDLQVSAKCSAVRQARAWTVRVGFLEPLVPIKEAPRIPKFGTS